MIALGDVAEVRDATDATLASVTLGPRSLRRHVTAQQVRDRLIAIGRYDSRTQIVGASRCELVAPSPAATAQPVRTAGQTAKRVKAALAETVRERIETALPEVGPVQVDVAVADEPAARVAALLDRGQPLRLRGGHADWRLPQAMEVLLPGKPVRFLATISTQPMVAVATGPLTRGQIVQASHVAWQPATEIDTARGLDDAALIVGRQATRTLAEGHVFTARDVRPVLMVRTGEIVTARIVGSGFQVSRTMRARGSGGRGDSVTLVSLDGKQTLGATVVDYHECEVGVGTDAALPSNVRFEGAGQ